MQRFKKWFSILLVLTFTFVAVIPPAGVLAAPFMRPPVTPTIPEVNPAAYKIREAPSAIGGVSYEFNPKVINLPTMPYTLEDIPDSEEIQGDAVARPGTIAKPGVGIDINLPRPGLAPTGLPAAAVPQEIPIYAKNLVINRGFELRPKLGDIYFDPATNAAFKVVGNASVDALGNQTIPVVEPGIDEVLQKFNVPNQTIPLTEGNIDFSSLPQGVEYVGIEDQSSSQGSNATVQGFDVSKKDNTYIFKLKDFVIYEYPDPKDTKEVEKAKKDAEKERKEAMEKAKKEGTYDYLENYNWTGVKDESSFGVKIKISEGTIKVTDPKINFDAGWDTLISPYAKAHCDVDMDIDSNITIQGDIKFKEERWQQIYGYFVCDNQKDPTVKIYVGIFAVVGLEGKLTFKVKVQQVGHMNHGVDMYFSSLVAPGVPLGVIPTGDFDAIEQSVGIIIDGSITAQAGVMAGFGIEIFDFKLLQVQLKLGLEGNCTFHIEAGDTEGMKGGGNAPPGGANASATFKLDFFVQLNAYIAGKGKALFELRLKLLEKAWSGSIGADGSAGAGSEGVSKIPCRTDVYIDKADAAEEMIEGHVVIGDPPNQRPYEGPVRVNVILYDWLGNHQGYRSFDLTTDASGKFYIRTSLSPFDYVAAQVGHETDIEVYRCATKAIKTTVPYSIIEFEPDAFNDLVYGNVSGKYNGPLWILVNRPGKSTAVYEAHVSNGKFELPVQLTGGDQVNVMLTFENLDIFALSGYMPANIDSLKINLTPDAAPSAENPDELEGATRGSVQNTKGETPYTGQVKLNVNRLVGLAADPTRMLLYSGTKTASPLVNEHSSSLWDQLTVSGADDILSTLPNAPETPNLEHLFGESGRPSNPKAISSFIFDNTPIPSLKREYIVEIEHEGIRKTEVVSYAIEGDYTPHWQSHGFEKDPTAVSPLRDIIDSRINPVTTRGLQMRGIDVMNIPQELLLQGLQQNITQQQQSVAYSNMPSQGFALKATGGDGCVNLEWRPAEGADIIGYNLFRGTSSGNYEKAPITDFAIDGTSYTDYNVKNGVTYYYIAKAVFKDNTESDPSNEVTVEPTQPTNSPALEPPVIKPPVANPPVIKPPITKPPLL